MSWWAGMSKWQEEEAIMRKLDRASTEKITKKSFPTKVAQAEYDRWAEKALQAQIAQAQAEMYQKGVESQLTVEQMNELMSIVRADMELQFKYDTLPAQYNTRPTMTKKDATMAMKDTSYTDDELEAFRKLKELKFNYKDFAGMLPPGAEKNFQYIPPDLTNEDTIKDIPEELI